MLHIIHNPHSGQASIRLAALTHRLKKERIPYILHSSKTPGQMADMLNSLQLTSSDRLLLIGGDGSLNTLVNHLARDLESRPAFLLFPSGSGNDFARGMGMKKGLDAMLMLLKKDQSILPIALDCGQVSQISRIGSIASPGEDHRSIRFMVSCGIGYDAGVCLAINRSKLKYYLNKIGMAKLAYLLLGIREIMRYTPADLQVRTDKGLELDLKNAAFLSCHNLPFEGGGFRFAPRANARDGRLNVCLITAKSRVGFALTLICSLFGGAHRFLPNVRSFSCRSLRVRSSRPLSFHTDGEVLEGVTGFQVSCQAHSIPVLYEYGRD